MDVDAEKRKLEDAQAYVQSYLDHPITKQLLEDSAADEEAFVKLICDQPIYNIETFFAHFEAVGHLRGLRQNKTRITEKLDDVKEQLKEIQDER